MANSANMLQLCRLCLVKEQVNIPIFEEQGDIRRIFQKISSCLPVKVSRDDKLPKKICDGCSYKLDICYEFWNTSANSEKQLLTWLGDLGVKNDNKISDSSKTSSSHSTNKHHQTDAPVVKKEEIDLSDAQDKDDDEDDENKAYMFQQKLEESNSSSGGPSATVTTNNEDESPPPKRQRRTAAVKAAIAMDHDSDDDDDSGEPLTKIEDETDDSDGDDNDPSFVDVPSTSADDQPGPSGVGKDNSDAPFVGIEIKEESFVETVEDFYIAEKDGYIAENVKNSCLTEERHGYFEKLADETIENSCIIEEDEYIEELSDDVVENSSIIEENEYIEELSDDAVENSSIIEGDEYIEELSDDTVENSSIIEEDEYIEELSDDTVENSSIIGDHDHIGEQNRLNELIMRQKYCLPKIVDVKKKDKYIYCELCNKPYKNNVTFSIHSILHSQDGKYYCYICDFRNPSKNVIGMHARAHDSRTWGIE